MYIEGQLPLSQVQTTESYLGADGSTRTLAYPIFLTHFNLIFRSTWERRLYFLSEGIFRPEKSDGFGRV
jgi:hypothetical protein